MYFWHAQKMWWLVEGRPLMPGMKTEWCLKLVLLGWWLIGFTYVPFVPVFYKCNKSGDSSTVDVDKGPSVTLEIPSCTFLSRARKVYDDIDKGNRACINEWQVGMEELFGPGILGAKWKVSPNLKTGRCKFVMEAQSALPPVKVRTQSQRKKIQKHIELSYEQNA